MSITTVIGIVLLVVFTAVFIYDVLYPKVINLYFKSKNFIAIKDRVNQHIDECNELNEHIEQLKLSYTHVESFDYGEGRLSDDSSYNMRRGQWATEMKNRWTHQCSSTIVKNANNQPFKYFCKYFNINSDEKTLEKFEEVLNDFSAVEQGKHLLTNERDAIVSSISDSIPAYILKNYRNRVNKELGFRDISLSGLYFPVYTFQYVSAGGNSSSRFDLKLDIEQLERFINYLANLVKFQNSVAGQRALMTPKLREKIKVRDGFTCKICSLSTADEKNLLLEIDHIIPLSKGGITSEDNLQTLCWKCNRSKGSKVLDTPNSIHNQAAENLKQNKAADSNAKQTKKIRDNIKLEQPKNLDNTKNHTPISDNAYLKASNPLYDEIKQQPSSNDEEVYLTYFPIDIDLEETLSEQTETKIETQKPETLTRAQMNALRSAKEYLEYSGYSRDGLIDQLHDGDKYAIIDATAAVDSLSIDWKEQAVKSAKDYIEYSGYSRKGLIEQLQDGDDYTAIDATAAVDSLDIDWKEQALKSAKDYIEYSGYSRKGLIEQLQDGDDYTAIDATAAVDNLDIDWKEQAVKSAKEYLEYSGYSRTGLIEQLHEGDEYTVSEATYGATKAGA